MPVLVLGNFVGIWGDGGVFRGFFEGWWGDCRTQNENQ